MLVGYDGTIGVRMRKGENHAPRIGVEEKIYVRTYIHVRSEVCSLVGNNMS
jgi:hypothetical protein